MKEPEHIFLVHVCVCVCECAVCVFFILWKALDLFAYLFCVYLNQHFSRFHRIILTGAHTFSQSLKRYTPKPSNIIQNVLIFYKNFADGKISTNEQTDVHTGKCVCVCVCVHKCVCVRECFNIKVTLINSFYSSSNVMGNDDAFMVIWLVLHFPCNILSLWLFPNEWTGRALELGWLLNKVEW